ncbi:DUF916 and DUF3324 domain-containing protein [Vagococcus hydrophili]|uniref:DUF916 and DUF3324 domain-containing protein n=1 Tax=Vagococcus hydrophili TaxID=2714947 RepID=A0A6G8ATG1_9ENTE|nr:DUF916 and DUF3324 domain-containing protein [Vagococcus hydrophili]QIL48225.1 DUF916 and DUF3324 domain-containing protein [Vagococcus hydrophili]
MINKPKKSIVVMIVSFLLCVFFISSPKQAFAQGKTGFTYNVEFPENQMRKDVGFFHLKMKPSQKQTLVIKMGNVSTEKTTVNISLNGAKTNTNGVIEYGNNSIKNDKSLKYDFKDVVKGPDKVELKPGEEKNVEFKIAMPETSYEGVISGGIQMIEAGQGEDQKKAGGSVVINEYAYVVGLQLQEEDKVVVPELKLNSVKPGQSNFKNTIFVNYSNVKAAYLNNMTTEVQIAEKGKDTVIFEKKQAKMRMAPNTMIDFPIDMNGEAMKAGDYTAKILVTADNDIREEWTKDFKITQEDADKFNERDVGLVQEKGLNWKMIILIVVGFFVVVVLIFIAVHLLRKNNKKSKSSKKKSKSKKK